MNSRYKKIGLSGHKLPLYLLLLIYSFWQPVWGQTTYYVAADGSDVNNGLSANTPFQSLARINSLSLQPGDNILLRRGDTFRGTLIVAQSGTADKPIVVDAYGSGNKPIIAGSLPITNWTNVGNNTWQANCPSCGGQVTGVYRNAVSLPLGRYPNLSDANKGYLTIQSHNGKTQLTSQQGFSTNWTGGEAVVRPYQWILDRAPITNQAGNTLMLNNTSDYDLNDGWGYFIQNHPATLDQTGEWYYNPSDKTIRLYDNQNDPNSQLITATAFEAGIDLMNSSYITVRNLKITETLTAGVSSKSGSNLSFSGNDITNSGYDGFILSGTGNTILAENNLIEDANNTGLLIEVYQNFTFRENTVRRIGLLPGRGTNGDGGYVGLQCRSNANALIENNVLESIGYNGISVASNTTVRYNQVFNFCLTKSDGGGIYSWNGNHSSPGGIHILSNIVYNGVGAPEGTLGGVYSGANGIFLDDCSQNSEIIGNTTFGSKGKGILLRGTSNITVSGNTVFDNGEEQIRIGYNDLCTNRDIAIQNNILVSKTADQGVAAYESNANDLNQYGRFDNNYYARPFDDLFKLWSVYDAGAGLTGKWVTLPEWQMQWGQDPNSKNSPITYKASTVTGVGANLLANTFTNTSEGWSGWSSYGNGQVVQAASDNAVMSPLDGGCLQIGFSKSSNRPGAYVVAYNSLGAVTKGKTYQIQFDAIASDSDKLLQIYLRQANAPWKDLTTRTTIRVGPARKSYTLTLTATDNETSALMLFQVIEDGEILWVDNVKLLEVGTSQLMSTFTNTSEGWSSWSPYGNGQATQVSTSPLDGGSLQVGFSKSSGSSNSFAIVYNSLGVVNRGKTYRIQFDAIASDNDKRLQVYLRQTSAPWKDLTNRAAVTVGTTRQHYDLTVTLTDDDANTLALFQVDEDGKTLWLDNVSIQDPSAAVSTQRLYNTFATSNDGWSNWSLFDNGQVIQVGAGQSGGGSLDGGKLQLSFSSASGKSDSYLIGISAVGSVENGKTYRLQFDAIASGNGKRLQVYLRQLYAPWRDLSARTTVLVNDTRQSYDQIIAATNNDANAVLVLQIGEDDKTLWTDNIKLQEVSIASKNPDDYMRIVYNPTFQNSTVSLNGTYRDVKNQVYSGQITLSPFTSVVLFRDESSGARTAAASVGKKSDTRVVYPIPTYDEFLFMADQAVQRLQVIDLMGRERLSHGTVDQGQSLPFGSELPAGQYLLQIHYEDGTRRVEKLLKINR